ncbi:MAG: TIGR00730 family Rossman fold protein [Niabella sp.]
MIQSLAVFCGSKEGNNVVFSEQANQLGKLLATHGIRLIYGGGNAGMMGVVANACLENGGTVIGVIPEMLEKIERSHKDITELLVVEDMHTRKKKMYELSDAAIILPGGYGTLDELFEMITWNNLYIHSKQIFILNSDGYYDYLLQHVQKMHEEGFLYESPETFITVLNKPEQLEAHIGSQQSPGLKTYS